MHFITQIRYTYIMFSLAPPDNKPVSASTALIGQNGAHEDDVTGRQRCRRKKDKSLENEAGTHLLYNIITRPTGILYKIQP